MPHIASMTAARSVYTLDSGVKLAVEVTDVDDCITVVTVEMIKGGAVASVTMPIDHFVALMRAVGIAPVGPNDT